MGSGAGSFLKVLLKNFDVLAGYAYFSFSKFEIFQQFGSVILENEKYSFRVSITRPFVNGYRE